MQEAYLRIHVHLEMGTRYRETWGNSMLMERRQAADVAFNTAGAWDTFITLNY